MDVPNETQIASSDFVKVGADIPDRSEATREGGFEEMVVVGCDVETEGPVGDAAVVGARHSDGGNLGLDAVVDVGAVGEFREGIERERKVLLGCDLASIVSIVMFTVKFISD